MVNEAEQDTRRKALDLISASVKKYTPGRLIAELSGESEINRAGAKRAVRSLIETGELVYVYQFGCSFLEKSIFKANQVSERVWLAPKGVPVGVEGDQVCVWLDFGGAFGTGQHPTTRLSIQAIDFLLHSQSQAGAEINGAALDIGTGSGVLAIVAVKLGMRKALGLDVEPIARKEAEENVIINGLADQVAVSADRLDALHDKFGLVTANLRLPTLLGMMPLIQKRSRSGAGLVLSGIKKEEAPLLQIECGKHDFRSIWGADEKGWACQVYIKK